MQWWRLQDSNFNGTGLHQRDLIEKFKSQLFKVTITGRPPRMFSSCFQCFTKNDVEFLPIKITSKKVCRNNVDISTREITPKKIRGNNVDFSTSEITPIKVRGNNVDFSTIEITSKKVGGNNVGISTMEITSKKVRGNNVDFSTSEITSKKVRGNDVDFSISEITSKKYVEMTWKFVEIWFSTYRRNIGVESTWIRRGVSLGSTSSSTLNLLMLFFERKSQTADNT